MREFSTPMMKQYQEIKQQYADCLLFFRLGDFYELFLEDALIGAKTLDITLTRRPRGKDGDIPMAGVPYHAADIYVSKLLKAGYKVAICEQVSEPDTKGIVEREVVRIITPGTVLDEKTLEQKQHNYVMSLSVESSMSGVALADVSTGDFYVTEFSSTENFEQSLHDYIMKFNPTECILAPQQYEDPTILRILQSYKGLNIYPFSEWQAFVDDAQENLQRHFRVRSLASFGLDKKPVAIHVAAALLGYIYHTQRKNVQHIRSIQVYESKDFVALDHATLVNLEVLSTIRERDVNGSLIDVIDETVTAMGGRLLRDWVRQPLVSRHKIQERLDAVEELMSDASRSELIRDGLRTMYDVDRILSRLTVGMGRASDLLNLRISLQGMVDIQRLLRDIHSPFLMQIEESVSASIENIITFIAERIVDEPPVEIKQGSYIREGVHAELDAIRKRMYEGKEWIAQIEARERKETSIQSLKVRFNKVFGYYIEVSKANLHLVPDTYIRKQSTVNAERFITDELKEYEEKILHAEERRIALEQELFEETIGEILEHIEDIQRVSHHMAILDCILSFATTATQHQYCKPVMTSTGEVHITDGRHPMVERVLDRLEFVPNDTTLNASDHQVLILTGPNMAGKSVYMRQVALIVLMAHVGMFVPASSASISLVDRIFVRSGAADAITSGLSTFMVEMVETANILHHATPKSLIVMDEIGRGTSTYDGISIAWAVAQYLLLNKQVAAKTLFATHYHELQDLEDVYPDQVKNYRMEVQEINNEPIFLHKLVQGRSSHSYAIAVAKMAGLPEAVTESAQQILHTLEKRDSQITPEPSSHNASHS